MKGAVNRHILIGLLAAVASLSLATSAVIATHGGPAPVAGVPPLLRPMLDFPVQASPRFIVLLQGPVSFDSGGPDTFPDPTSRFSYAVGAIDPPADFPNGPGWADGYPIMGSAEAYQLVTDHGGGASQVHQADRLHVTGVSFGSAMFHTDRGYLKLPAWLFGISESSSPTPVLAVAPSMQLTPAGLTPNSETFMPEVAIVGSDQRTLTVGLIGGAPGTGPCTYDYTLAAREYSTFVALQVTAHYHGTGHETCTLEGHFRTASTRIDARVGNRLLVRATTGTVLIACPPHVECDVMAQPWVPISGRS